MQLPQFIKDIVASLMIILAMTPVTVLVTAPQPAEAQSVFGMSLCDVQNYISGAIDSAYNYVVDLVAPSFEAMFGELVDSAQEVLSNGLDYLRSFLPQSVSETIDNAIAAVADIEVPVYDDSIAEQVETGVTPLNNSVQTLVQKECILDGITWVLARYIIESMTESLIVWIQNDFEGGPQFVTDFNAFMVDIADRAFGDIINNTQFGFLCEAFDFDIRFALTANVFGQADDRVSCRISEIVTNIENFYAGNFSEGSWEGWFAMNLDSSSNPYGAYLGLMAEANAVMAKKTNEYGFNINNGDGYNCKIGANDRCVTPGSNISEQFNRVMGAQVDQLITADEVDELLGALFQYLVSEVFADDEGLAGSRFNERARESRQRESINNQIGSLLGRINTALNDTNLTPTEAAELQTLRQELQQIRTSGLGNSGVNAQLSSISSQIAAIEAALRTRGQQPTADNETPPSNVAPPLPGSPSFDPSGNTLPSVPPNQPTPGTTPTGSDGGLPAPPANPDGGGSGGGGIDGVPPPPPPPPAL